jgi:heme/copper-type cytochrome/quinol oxidase subunit 2
MSDVLFMKDITFLSYFQSALRNVIVFSTLSMAFIREAVVYKGKNKLYNMIYLLFAFTFLTIGLVLNYILLEDTRKYNSSKKDSEKSKDVKYDLMIIYVIFCIMILFMCFTVYRMYRNMIHL